MTRIVEVTETDLNQLLRQTKVVDEILLMRQGKQIARILPPTAVSSVNETTAAAVSQLTDIGRHPSFFVAEEGDVMEEEIAAYEAQHKELVQQYLGQYVAISQKAVVDHDHDRSALRKRIAHDYPNRIVLVRQVKAKLPDPIYIRSPKLSYDQ